MIFNPADPLAALRPYALLIKAGLVVAAIVGVYLIGRGHGARQAEDELAAFKVEVAEGNLKAQRDLFESAWAKREEIDEQARELANSLDQQARIAADLRAALAEARRRGTLTRKDPATNCARLDDGFARLWNAAAVPGAAPSS